VQQTYFENNAFRARMGFQTVSLDPLTARSPFRVDGVEKLKVDLKVMPQVEVVSGSLCRRGVLTFSYSLKLGLATPANVAMIGRVEGAEDFCVMDAPAISRLPFRVGRGSAVDLVPAVRELLAKRRAG